MLKVLSSILCDLDPKVKVVGQKAGICDGVPSTSALVFHAFVVVCRLFSKLTFSKHYQSYKQFESRSGTTFCWSLSVSKLFAKVSSSREKSLIARKELLFISKVIVSTVKYKYFFFSQV